MSAAKSIDIKKSVVDTVLAGLISLIVFGPIVGVVLDGYSFNLEPARVAVLVAIVMAGRFALSLFLQTPKGVKILQGFESSGSGVHVLPPDYKSRLRWIIPALIVIAIVFPIFANKYLLTVVILGLIYVLLGLGLNIVVGLAGLLDLGYVAFYAIGAYGLALGYQYLGLGFWTVLPLAAIAAALAGCILGFPVLRMHGDYLAIVTLGFGEIIRLVLNNWLSFTGGPNGMPVPSPTFLGLEFGKRAKDGGIPFHEFFGIDYNPNIKFMFIYIVLFLVVLAVLYIKHRLTRMPVGRAWEALREDEIACRSMGLNHVLVKLSAFTIGASTAGLAGVFFASYQGFVNPSSFTFFESALILAIVVLGGMGSTVGVVIAAFVLTVAPELLRSFSEYRVLLFGVLMVVMMIWRPRGLIRISRTGVTPRKGGSAMSKEVVLSVEHLMMHFGGIKALSDVSLQVKRNSIFALIGPNGAGKTTVFNCLTGFYKASGGKIELNVRGKQTNVIQLLGERFEATDFVSPKSFLSRVYYKMFGGTHLVNRAGLARTFQNIRLFKEMSVLENLLVAQHMWGQPQHARRHPQYQGLPQGRKRCAGLRVLLAGSGRPGGLRQPPGRRALLRPAAPPGDRPRHVHAAADHLPGRTGSGPQPSGNRSPQRDDSPAARRTRPDGGADRTRHGHGDEYFRPHCGAGPRQRDRRRRPGCDPQRPQSDRRLPGRG